MSRWLYVWTISCLSCDDVSKLSRVRSFDAAFDGAGDDGDDNDIDDDGSGSALVESEKYEMCDFHEAAEEIGTLFRLSTSSAADSSTGDLGCRISSLMAI